MIAFARRVTLIAAAALLLAAPSALAQNTGGYELTLIHINDGESQIVNAGGANTSYGGVARVATLIDQMRSEATAGAAAGQAGLAQRIAQREAACKALSDSFASLIATAENKLKKAKSKKAKKNVRRQLNRFRDDQRVRVAACRDAAQAQNAAETKGYGTALISSGDNIIPSPEFTGSLRNRDATGQDHYDATFFNLLGVDASTLGNHEFDNGPETLAGYISDHTSTKFLSSNLGFSGEPTLQAQITAGRLAKSTILNRGGERIGVVGATTELLPTISSPRNVTVSAVLPAVQAEIDALTAQGVNKIILASHLQAISNEAALVPQLRGVDIVIAGGGQETLANAGTPLVPGDAISAAPNNVYPRVVSNQNGVPVPIVTTNGDYKYVGKLVANFDSTGRLTTFNGGPVRVSGATPENTAENPTVKTQVTDPTAAFLAQLAATVVATTDVGLNGLRSAVRTRETNLGNLFADAILWEADRRNEEFSAPNPEVAIQNAGGIRNNTTIGNSTPPVDNVTELNTFEIAAFFNLVSVVPNVTPQKLKELLEHSVQLLPTEQGRFAQIAGMKFTYDLSGTAQVTDAPTGVVTTPGTRVQDITVGGVPYYVDGVLQGTPSNVDVATIDFLARNAGGGFGDGYPFAGTSFTVLGSTYQEALFRYLTAPTGLNGTVTGAQYPDPPNDRITVDP